MSGDSALVFTDPVFIAVAVFSVLLAGISKGGFGSGGAFVATPLLALVIGPELALGLMLPLLMFIDVLTLRPYWRRWDAADARILVLGGVPGVALGIVVYGIANADALRLLIGAISIAFVAFQIGRARGLIRPPAQRPGRKAGLLAGVVAGLTSYISHAGGPPVAIYMLARGHSKTSYQATTVLVFWIINWMKAVPYGFLGVFTIETLKLGLYLAPVAALGAWAGVVAHRMVPERWFFRLTYALLLAAGTKLIWDALT